MLEYFTNKTNIGKIISNLKAYKNDQKIDLEFYVEYESETRKQYQPFLSIITRTQGNRLLELREVFLCLSAQVNIDFEIILIGHKIDKFKRDEILQIINQQIPWLREKIFFINLSCGNRTTPLNLGFSLAKGKYISILDDDDIVFSNWIDEFYKEFLQSNGTIFHSFTATQDWIKIYKGALHSCIRAESAPKPIFCKPYDWINQIRSNACPSIGLAFPAYIFQSYNIRFDEKLTTTEDWDFLLRTSIFTGVSDIECVTSIYRQWKNAANSSTIHSQQEWKSNHKKIQQKLANSFYIISEKEIKEIISNSDTKLKIKFFYKICKVKIFIAIWDFLKLHFPSIAKKIKNITKFKL